MKPPKSSPPIISKEIESALWEAGYDHGGTDVHDDEHGHNDSEPMEHNPRLCPRCAAGKDTEMYWHPDRGKRLLDMSPEELDAVFDEAIEKVGAGDFDLTPGTLAEVAPPWQGEG